MRRADNTERESRVKLKLKTPESNFSDIQGPCEGSQSCRLHSQFWELNTGEAVHNRTQPIAQQQQESQSHAARWA